MQVLGQVKNVQILLFKSESMLRTAFRVSSNDTQGIFL